MQKENRKRKHEREEKVTQGERENSPPEINNKLKKIDNMIRYDVTAEAKRGACDEGRGPTGRKNNDKKASGNAEARRQRGEREEKREEKESRVDG